MPGKSSARAIRCGIGRSTVRHPVLLGSDRPPAVGSKPSPKELKLDRTYIDIAATVSENASSMIRFLRITQSVTPFSVLLGPAQLSLAWLISSGQCVCVGVCVCVCVCVGVCG